MVSKNFSLFLSFLFVFNSLLAQNSPPVLSNITALADTILHKLTVTYDVSDAENDTLEIFLAVSADGGNYFPFNTDNAAGDIGFPVIAGAGKRIVWEYPDSLSSMVASFVIKLAANDRFGINIQQIIDQIDTGRLKQNLQFIAGIRHRTTGATHLQEVRDSVIARFQQYGLQTRIHSFPYNSYTGQNLIGRKQSALYNTRTYIVDGHYDTVDDSPGADDNGSSIAGFLEILRIIAPLELSSVVEFIGFDLEEAGLLGSEAFVPDGIQADEDIHGVINMDMIGYYTETPNSQAVPPGFEIAFPDLYAQLVADSFRGNFIISTANTNSSSLLLLFDSMATQYVPDLMVGSIKVPGTGTIIPDSRRSDHAAFWDAGYKALHLSDGAETRNPNYHGPGDAESTINYTFMRNVTRAAAATLLSLAQPLHASVETATVTPDPASAVSMRSGCEILVSARTSKESVVLSFTNCNAEKATFALLAADGKEILRTQIVADGDQEIKPKNTLSPGCYFLELKTHSGKTLVRQFFVR